MSVRTLVGASAVLLALAACAGGEVPDSAPESEADMEARARSIHERVMTLDTHVDIAGGFALLPPARAPPALAPGQRRTPQAESGLSGPPTA